MFYHVLYEFFGNFRTKNLYDFDKIIRLNFKSIKSETDCYWSEKIPNIIFTTGTYAKCEKTGANDEVRITPHPTSAIGPKSSP